MKFRSAKTALFAALPLLCLAAGASATQQIGAWLDVPDGTVPDGAKIRLCFNHHDLLAASQAAALDGSLPVTSCNVNTNVTAQTAGNTAWAGNDTTVNCNPNSLPGHSSHHTVFLIDASTGERFCQGTDPSNPASTVSFQWNSDLSSTPHKGTTECTTNPGRTQFSTDNGAHYSSCASRGIKAVSLGRGAP